MPEYHGYGSPAHKKALNPLPELRAFNVLMKLSDYMATCMASLAVQHHKLKLVSIHSLQGRQDQNPRPLTSSTANSDRR